MSRNEAEAIEKDLSPPFQVAKPAELAAFARRAGLESDAIIGMTYNPLTRAYRLEADTSVNYIAAFHREA